MDFVQWRIKMKPLIYIRKGIIYDRNNRQYDYCLSFADVDEVDPQKGELLLSHGDFEKYITTQKPRGLRIIFETQEEFEYLINIIHPFVSSIYLHEKHNRAYDLTPLQKCSELEAVQFYWNTKQETLWDVKKNRKLKSFHMTDFYNVTDFSALRGSSIETLELFGCNGASSFVSKLHIDDLSFILDMPHLRALRLDIIKDESSEYYLKLLARCQELELFSTSDSFFTFQQFAWLKAHLPNVKEGLNCVEKYGDDWYGIIGRRTPKTLTDFTKTEKYQKRYDALVEKYKFRDTPPSDEEKD